MKEAEEALVEDALADPATVSKLTFRKPSLMGRFLFYIEFVLKRIYNIYMKKTSFERIVGKVSESGKEKILKSKEERFEDQSFEELKDKEREKTPEELEIISLANKMTNEVRRSYGLEDFDIPAKNIHVIKKEKWWNDNNSAVYKPSLQGICIEERLANVSFAKEVFHELIHFKSYEALHVVEGKERVLESYRSGLVMKTRDGKDIYFSSLNEGVTEELTKRYIKKNINEISQNPIFIEEIEKTRKIINEHPDAKTNSGDKLFTDDVFYAEIIDISKDKNKVSIKTDGFTYQKERHLLSDLISKLFEKNKEEFKNKDEIFNLFVKGMMTGNILPIGKLIDSTFGVGTLRKIGEMKNDVDTQQRFVDSL